jgi:hypothetical protein
MGQHLADVGDHRLNPFGDGGTRIMKREPKHSTVAYLRSSTVGAERSFDFFSRNVWPKFRRPNALQNRIPGPLKHRTAEPFPGRRNPENSILPIGESR